MKDRTLPPGPWKAILDTEDDIIWVLDRDGKSVLNSSPLIKLRIEATPTVIAAIEALPTLVEAAREMVAADTFGKYTDAHTALRDVLALVDGSGAGAEAHRE